MVSKLKHILGQIKSTPVEFGKLCGKGMQEIRSTNYYGSV